MISMSALIALALLAADSRAGLPLSDPLWQWLRPAATSRGLPLGGIRPLCGLPGDAGGAWSPLQKAAATLAAEGRHAVGGGWLGIDGRAVLEGGADDGGQVRAGTALRVRADITDDLSLHERLSVWSGSDELPPHHFSPYHLGEEEGRHLYADWGYASYSPGAVRLDLGRIPQSWGPGRYNNLLLSDNSPALDMLLFSAAPSDWLTFTGFTASVRSDSAAYLSLHRLELSPAANLRIGLSEAVFFCSDGLELAYMNPFIPYYPVQWNERDDDNAFLAFDGEWMPVAGLSVWGELLVDDFQYRSEFDRPNKLAWTVGTETAWRSGAFANVEYTRVDRYVYSQRRSCNYYLHDGRIIGSPLGPDADCVTVGGGWAGLWPLTAGARVSHRRKGEGTVYEGWPDYATSGGEFPSGTVEYRTEAALRLSAYPAEQLELHGGVSRNWLRNAEHVPGASESGEAGWLQAVWKW
jgi:hypothetical protein